MISLVIALYFALIQPFVWGSEMSDFGGFAAVCLELLVYSAVVVIGIYGSYKLIWFIVEGFKYKDEYEDKETD